MVEELLQRSRHRPMPRRRCHGVDFPPRPSRPGASGTPHTDFLLGPATVGPLCQPKKVEGGPWSKTTAPPFPLCIKIHRSDAIGYVPAAPRTGTAQAPHTHTGVGFKFQLSLSPRSRLQKTAELPCVPRIIGYIRPGVNREHGTSTAKARECKTASIIIRGRPRPLSLFPLPSAQMRYSALQCASSPAGGSWRTFPRRKR